MKSIKTNGEQQPDQGALQDSEALLGALVSAAVDGIVVIDSQGTIQLFGSGAERMFGYRQDQVLGRNIKMLMPEPYRGEHDGYIRNYERSRRARIIGSGREVTAMDRDGVEFPVDLAVGEAKIAGRSVYVGIIRDLRSRSHIESMLQQERRRAERVFDLVEVVIMGVDAQGHILLLNRKAGELFGGIESPIGKYWVKDFVIEPDQESTGAVFREIFTRQTATPVAGEYRITDTEGQEHCLAWQHQYIAATESGEAELVLCSGVDVTETHRIAKLLRASEQRLRLSIEQAPLGIATLDLQGIITEANRALCGMLEINPEETRGLEFGQLISSEHHSECAAKLAEVASGKTENSKADCTLTWGAQLIRAEVSLGLIRNPDNRPASILIQIRDKTAQLQAEAEVESMRNRLAHVHRLGIMGEMAAGIAHEINQPLGAITTYADGAMRMMAAEPPKLDDARFGLQQIGTQARHAAEVVKRMRTMARKQVGASEVRDINQLIRDLVALADLEARRVGAPLILELAANLPRVAVDAVQVQQVLLNLIRNSLDAFATRSQAARGVTLGTELTSDGMLYVTVADHGVGMSETEAGQIFDAFYTTKPDGMGMGLSICSTIIRAHRGRLWWEPNDDGGSRFIFSLPVEAQQ